ncbi:DUF401 family protein [Chloroflexota bacterium]
MVSPSLALLISVAGILILLRLKVHPGFAVFAGSLIVALLVLPLQSIPSLMRGSLFQYQTIRLLVIIASALTLSRLMEEKGLLAKLATAMESISPKLALHFIPAAIGLVPMPAGALVSATASRSLIGRIGLAPEQGTFINYWFRHVWEFSIPTYPAIVLTSVIFSVPISLVVVTLSPLTALSIASGAVISYGILKKTKKVKGNPIKNIVFKLLGSSWPILILVPSILLGLEAMIAFPLMLALLAIQQRAKWPELKKAFKYGLDPKILFLLYAVMTYKTIIESSGAAQAVFSDMQTMGLPTVIMLITLPLLMGLATGFSVAFVGIALPLLVPYIALDSNIHGYALILAYASGFMGVMLSPLHLCLILSTEYFKANLGKVYRYLLPPFIMVEGIAVLIYYIAS